MLYPSWLFRKKTLKRVCFLNPQGYVQNPPPLGQTDTGGQTLYILQLAKALGKRNIKVDIFTRHFDDFPLEEKVFENVRIVRIPAGPHSFIPKEKMYEVIPEFNQNVLTYIGHHRKRYSIIHSHYWDGGYAGITIAKELKIPHIHTPHSLGKLKQLDVDVVKTPVQKLKPVYRYQVRIAIEQRILSTVDAVVVLCETSRIQLLERYHVDFEKLHVIYPGIDISTFNTKKSEFDKQVGFGENAILTVSRLVPAKGLDRVIDAVRLLKGKVPFHLYMGGGGNETQKSDEEIQTEAQLRDMIKKYSLQKQVTFLGFIPHDTMLPAYYRTADVFILAGRYEPFGLTTLEAMACGTAPLVSAVAGSREVIVDNVNGFLIDMHDRKALSQKIFQLLTDKKLNNRTSENAALTVQENYAWDKLVDKFIKLYREHL